MSVLGRNRMKSVYLGKGPRHVTCLPRCHLTDLQTAYISSQAPLSLVTVISRVADAFKHGHIFRHALACECVPVQACFYDRDTIAPWNMPKPPVGWLLGQGPEWLSPCSISRSSCLLPDVRGRSARCLSGSRSFCPR